jgi:phosphopantothenoylcysteine decarboxylase/phosphopantothenate--cysteine ligase
MSIQLKPNRDILADVSRLDQRPFCVGFAAETENLEKNARDKLLRKNLDMIAANQVGGDFGGFEHNLNELNVFWHDGNQVIALADKIEIAKQLIDLIAERYISTLSK